MASPHLKAKKKAFKRRVNDLKAGRTRVDTDYGFVNIGPRKHYGVTIHAMNIHIHDTPISCELTADQALILRNGLDLALDRHAKSLKHASSHFERHPDDKSLAWSRNNRGNAV